jgi:DNA-binding response OmpR family regulator
MHNILIVEDDISLNNGIVLILKSEDYTFTQAFNISEAKIHLLKSTFDLILLDINLPDGSGLDLCKHIKNTTNTPLMFLSANDMELDVVMGFEVGADDYVTKPFSLMILRARVAALLRRNTIQNDTKTIIDDYSFDFEAMQFIKLNECIELSKTEQKLLKLLIINKGLVLSRSTLIDKIWTDASEYIDENALSVTIKRLRDKLETDASKPKYIKTVYGIGYTWVVNPDE